MEQITLTVKQGSMPMVPSFSSVRDALKGRGRQNDNIMALLVFDWPVVQQMVEALARHISDALLDKRGPVLYSIVEGTILDYQKFSLEARRCGQPDAARLAAFASALIHNTASQLCYEVSVESQLYWRVDGKGAFSSWYQNASQLSREQDWCIEKLSECSSSGPIALDALYKTVINPKTQSIFKELGYEQAVVSGRASAGATTGCSADPSAR